jgi:hypothetical protein
MITPAGCISLAQEYLRATLGDSPTFRQWCGAVAQVQAQGLTDPDAVAAAEQAAALARIYHEALPAPAVNTTYSLAEWAALRPYAVVSLDQHNGLRKVHAATSNNYGFFDTGRLWLLLAAAPGEGMSEAAADFAFKNAVGQILDDLCGLAGLPGYIAAESITLVTWGRNTHEDAAGSGEELIAVLSIEWGPRQ